MMKALPSPALPARYVSAGEMKPQRRNPALVALRAAFGFAVLCYCAAGWVIALT
jgi:hypothetical protein